MRFITVLLVLWSGFSFGQSYDPLAPPNSYQSPENPNYWKNKMPHGAYWQQDVHYTIKASLNINNHQLSASETLIYTNNSPDDLKELFFHLYQNAFLPGSYYDNLQINNKRNNRYGENESQGLGTVVSNLTVNGTPVKTELDNTIMRVILNEPLKSGESAEISMNFDTYFDPDGNVRRRMKVFDSWGSKHYDAVHWYPRISVYDAKFGWTTDQHLGREFYGDFGCYDVELTLPHNYVLDGTGFMLNRDEVYPAELRQKLDVRNFARKPWNSKPSVITEYDSTKFKTWKFHAENVHDFAWTADPNYRIAEAEWNGIKCYGLAQEPHAAGWQNSAAYTTQIIKTFSEDFGQYVYHKMIVADARDGMEYPMLTLDGGYDPSYRGLLVHEVGHNWFFGQVGNNETYRASMDEGFTQFLTAWGLERIDGDTIVSFPYRAKYHRRFKKPQIARYAKVYNAYLRDALVYEDAVLNTHSDGFGGALRHGGGYGHVYYKTATMLFNLQYVLGDSLFSKAMKNYFNQWKIAHPYFEDFRASIINYTDVDLNWFFDQWFTTTKRIDYSIDKVKKVSGDHEYEFTLKRKGRMQMPLDLTAVDVNGKRYQYHVPNSWFVKEGNFDTLPRWIGWDKLQPSYTAKIKLDDKLEVLQIDTSMRLADVNLMNNSSDGNVSFSFDHRLYNAPSWDKYEVFVRPEIWWNAYDGIKAGFHFNGDYMDRIHFFDLTFWYNTGQLQDPSHYPDADRLLFDDYSIRINYRTPTNKFMKKSMIRLGAKMLDGFWENMVAFQKRSDDNRSSFNVDLRTMIRPNSGGQNYLIYANDWNVNRWNNHVNVTMKHNYKYKKGKGEIEMKLRSSTLLSDYSYAYARLNVTNNNRLGKLNWKTRVFVQVGSGSNWAPESRLFLAGGNPEDMMNNKYMRSVGFVPPFSDGPGGGVTSFTGIGGGLGHLHYGGGLNVRAYSGYLAPTVNSDGYITTTYAGESGASFNIEVDFNKYIGWKPKLSRTFHVATYLFADAGIINRSNSSSQFEFDNLRADAGLGTALTIKRFWKLEKVKPLVIRFDMPFVINRIPSNESNFVDFRWVVGVNRAF